MPSRIRASTPSLTTETGSSNCAGTARRDWTERLYGFSTARKSDASRSSKGRPGAATTSAPSCEAHFADLVGFLEGMEVPFVLDHRLVRGLDYYTRTVFEVQTAAEGAQNALGGGGRYDGFDRGDWG